VKQCFLNQSRGYFVISDAAVAAMEAVGTCVKDLAAFQVGPDTHATNLKLLATNIRVTIANKYNKHLGWAINFDASKLHLFLGICPRFKGVKVLRDYLRVTQPEGTTEQAVTEKFKLLSSKFSSS